MSYLVSRGANAYVGVEKKRVVVHNLDDGSTERELYPGRQLQFRPIGGSLQVGGLRHTASQFGQPVAPARRVGKVSARGILPMHLALKQVNSPGLPEWDEPKLMAELRKLRGYNRTFTIVEESTGEEVTAPPKFGGDTRTIEEKLEAADRKVKKESEVKESKIAEMLELHGIEKRPNTRIWCHPCQVEKSAKGIKGHIGSAAHQENWKKWCEAQGV